MRRLRIVLLVLIEAGCSFTRQQPAVVKAAEYLWGQQSEDGGWHSHTYGLLRSGQSLTPFVLEALVEIPDGVYPTPAGKLDRAIAFLQHNTQAGAIGMTDPEIPDYPNYATALAVSALSRVRPPAWQSRIQPMVEYLRKQQFTEQNGWRPEDPAYGAWGMGGVPRTPPNTGHVDLSMTRHVIEALGAAGVAASDPAFACARVFIERCQNFDPQRPIDTDGGFFFSTTEVETNKAGRDGTRFRSYGTTTADGILALIVLGYPPSDARLRGAERWLTTHHRDLAVPGFVGEVYQRWPRGLAFYYASASTQAFRALGLPSAAQVAENLKQTQRPDGSWANPENLVKEDDPLIATPFAVRALVASGSLH